MKNMMGLLTLFVVLVFAAPARSSPIIDLRTGTTGAGGTLTIAPDGNVTGTNIPLGLIEIAGMGSPYDGVYGLTSTVLNFDTQANVITVTGAIPSFSITSTELLRGSFTSFSIAWETPTMGGFNGTGPDNKSEDLLTYLGLSPNQPFEFFGFTLGFSGAGSGSPYTVISTDIVNTAVPEPASLLLLGTGLLALASFSRKRET
jgi:hypothetical protein